MRVINTREKETPLKLRAKAGTKPNIFN